MGSPLVSVIVPVYNSERYLPELLDSLLNQTMRDFELVCVNDGSTDGSLCCLRAYANKDRRVKVFDRRNGGVSEARNFGLRASRGEFICFVDSDDFVESNMLESTTKLACDSDADVVLFNIDRYLEKEGQFAPMPWAIVEGALPVGIVFDPCAVENYYKKVVGFTVNKLYRGDYLRKLGISFPSVGAHEDMPFTYVALSATSKLLYTDVVYYHYRRQREGSRSDETAETYVHMFKALEQLRHELMKARIWQRYEKHFIDYVAHMIAWKWRSIPDSLREGYKTDVRMKWARCFGLYYYPASFYSDKGDCKCVKQLIGS